LFSFAFIFSSTISSHFTTEARLWFHCCSIQFLTLYHLVNFIVVSSELYLQYCPFFISSLFSFSITILHFYHLFTIVLFHSHIFFRHLCLLSLYLPSSELFKSFFVVLPRVLSNRHPRSQHRQRSGHRRHSGNGTSLSTSSSSQCSTDRRSNHFTINRRSANSSSALLDRTTACAHRRRHRCTTNTTRNSGPLKTGFSVCAYAETAAGRARPARTHRGIRTAGRRRRRFHQSQPGRCGARARCMGAVHGRGARASSCAHRTPKLNFTPLS
jgi:hypothetical protein